MTVVKTEIPGSTLQKIRRRRRRRFAVRHDVAELRAFPAPSLPSCHGPGLGQALQL